ncbi:unnamed protein product [Schistosoma mattheei]|uniref:non-specific serine/threonine protein kinase n=1 Tax=Schistosoma mattheei TaxID=31246 RepID=A0AA85ARS8_9TREM|nr:unnamed protein product [Schistosoma mattheei]
MANNEGRNGGLQKRRHPPQLFRQMEQDEVAFPQTSCTEVEEYNLKIPVSANHSHLSTKSNSHAPSNAQTVAVSSDKPIFHSSVAAVKRHHGIHPRFPPPEDSRASSSTGSATTGGTSVGSQSSGGKDSSSGSDKARLACSSALNKGTRCGSSASSSTEETEAREKRFGSVDLHPLPSVALTAIMNQAMRRSFYAESSVQNAEQLQYATLLSAHKNYGDSSGPIDVKMNAPSVPPSKSDLVNLFSQTPEHANINSVPPSVHSATIKIDLPKFNQNLPLHLISPNLWPRLICPIHGDNLLAQFSQALCKRKNDISETDSEQEMSNLPVLSTKNEQSLTNITSSTLGESKQDYNNNNSSKQAANATITAPVPGTSVYGIPTMGYFNNVSEPNNNNTVQPNGPQRIGPYYLGSTLGRGNFAVVKLGKHSQLSVKVAIKIMNKDLIGSKNLGKVSRELEAMKRCQHPHIIRLYHVMETESNIFMVTEYASKGEVFDHISLSHAFTEKEARELFWQIVCAIEFCHASGIVHRDLKAENLLLDADFKIKVADFGFCNFFQNDQLLSTHCGSPQYAAPELFKGEPYDGTLADVWSLGVILYILVCGSFPFPGESLGDIRTQVLRGLVRFPFYLSTSCEQVIRCMLQVDPNRRFKLKQVTTTAWMQESPNVEHYKSLMDKYQKQAKERQFEVLFRHQHPEHSKIAKEEFLERIERKLDIGVVKALSREAGLDEEQIRQSTIQKKYDRYHAAYELLKEKIKTFYHNPILRNFVNDEAKKQAGIYSKLVTTQRPAWQPTSDILGGCNLSEEQVNTNVLSITTSTTQPSAMLSVLDETMLEEQTPPSDIIMSSDSSDLSDVMMKDTSLSCTSVHTTTSTTMSTVFITSSNLEKSENSCTYNKQNTIVTTNKNDFSESSLKEWKCATQPKNTELNAAICILKADEDEILSNFGIDSGPINKSFSNSIRRHTLQFTTSLFRKPSNQRDNPDNILTNNDDVSNHQSDTSSATINSMSIKNSNAKAKQSHELTDVNNNSKSSSSDENNSSNSKTNGNSVKRTTVRRFPRQITQPHSNRLQYNQTSPDNSDQMLLNRLDWLPNTWETTQTGYRKSHLLQSSRPYLNKISKQNEQTLTSLELGQEAATTKLPPMKRDTITIETTTGDDEEEAEQDDVSILIDQENILPEEISQSIQFTENISSVGDYDVTVMNKPNMVSEKAECPNPVECPYESTSKSQLIPSQYTNSQTPSCDPLLLDRIPEQTSIDMNTETNEKVNDTAHVLIEKPTLLEDPCWSAVRISGGVDEDDDNSCDPTAGVLRTLLPQLNLPANLPAMIHQPVACFTVKDPNLLAPPEFMTPHSSSFPRRSSDGAADLQPLHRPVITVGGSYPEQANYRKEDSGAESENSSLSVINTVHNSKPNSIEGTTSSVKNSDWIQTSRPKHDNFENSKPLSSSSSDQPQQSCQQQQLPESRSRTLAAQQRSLFSALHSQRRRLPLGLWWKLTHKKFNQPGENLKSELWDGQFIRHQKRFSLPVNCGPVRQPSGTIKTELQCRCHQPLTSELLQEIEQKLHDTSWIQKIPASQISNMQCITSENKFNIEEIPEIYRRGSEASQMSAWEQRLRQYNDLYDPGAHAQVTSSFHQAVPEIEADEDEEKLVSNYPFFTSPYTDDTSVPNTRLITTKCQDISSYNETIDTVTSRTNTSTPQFVQYKTQQYLSSSFIDDNPSNPISNKPYDSHISAPNVSPISQSGIELTDLKTELHNLEAERSAGHSSFTGGILVSSIESSRSVDDNKIHKSNESTHLPEFILSSETSNIPSFLSDCAINMQQSTLPIKYTLIPNEQSPSTSSYTHRSSGDFDNKTHRRASSVIDNPVTLNYLIPPDRDICETSKDNIRRHRHSVSEMVDNKQNSKFNYEFCSGVGSDVFNVSSELHQPTIHVGLSPDLESTEVQLHDEMSIKSLSSFSMVETPSNTNMNNTGIGQRLFERLHPDRPNYLHILQHSGGSSDRRLSPDFLRSPRKKIYQEWLPKLTELSHKAFDVARDKMNKVRATTNSQSLVYNLVHSDILHPSTHCYTANKTNSMHKDERNNECCLSDIINKSQVGQNSSTTGVILHEKDDKVNPVDVDPDPELDPDIDEEEDDEKNCALAPLQTHKINANNPSTHHSSRQRHRIMNQNIGQNLTYPQQVMPFFHGNLLNPTVIQQQNQNTLISQLPSGTTGINTYGLQDLVDFSNPQALPAAAAAASLLLFRSSDDDEDLAAIDRVNQRLALSRLTGNFTDTNQLINDYPNLLGPTPPHQTLTPQPQSLLPPTIQPIRSLPITQSTLQTQFSHSTTINEALVNRRNNVLHHDSHNYSQSSTISTNPHTITDIDDINAPINSQAPRSYETASNYDQK